MATKNYAFVFFSCCIISVPILHNSDKKSLIYIGFTTNFFDMYTLTKYTKYTSLNNMPTDCEVQPYYYLGTYFGTNPLLATAEE